MKRKIAAIFAADVAGYSRLVADDEEETLRRLASYRGVMDDFIARAGGRIFNTAGDAVLAEFSSAVEAVRCAIDIQESLRTRNMAYPPSRQMSFRIGITVGDVVERDGDLLGDGVNIAARLEGIAPVGGICISRTVHEQVANKLSVAFADIGEQQVKNIPTPVHAYKIEMHSDDPRVDARPVKTVAWVRPAMIAAACVVAVAVAALVFWPVSKSNAPTMSQSAAPVVTATPIAPAAPAAPAATARPAPPPQRQAETLVPETIPLIADRARASIHSEYMPAADHKALAISTGPIGFITGQSDDETAKVAALGICQKRADALPRRPRCELYAIGNTVVYTGGRPPMPPTPWFTRDPATERPFAVADLPLVSENAKPNIAQRYRQLAPPKALVISPQGGFFFYGEDSTEGAARRTLEVCGSTAGVPCLLVAVDDDFVVPIPMTMKAVGFFRPAGAAAIAPELRDAVARRLANAGGWTAVAAGADGKAGVMVQAANEQAAVEGALADCTKQDRSCRIIALGPFAVGPK